MAHDVSHVVFGCDTSFDGEIEVRTWSERGAAWDAPLAQRTTRERAQKMSKKWPFFSSETYFDRLTSSVRAELAIDVRA